MWGGRLRFLRPGLLIMMAGAAVRGHVVLLLLVRPAIRLGSPFLLAAGSNRHAQDVNVCWQLSRGITYPFLKGSTLQEI